MPSTIPYDPSLVLGEIVNKDTLAKVEEIAKAQAPADASQTELNSLISLKRSMEMTIEEMVQMKIEVKDLVKKTEKIDTEIATAAGAYVDARIKADQAIQKIKKDMKMVSSSIESPVDFSQSVLKPMPLAVDSMELNVQYLTNDENKEGNNSHASEVSAFVSASVRYLGDRVSSEATIATQKQVASQTAKHSIEGTLVVCITCTHKTAQVFAPLVLDVDKSIAAWNATYPSQAIEDDAKAIKKIEEEKGKDGDSFAVLSGATYGSSFVGMVHILRTENTQSYQKMQSVASSMQASFDIGGWFASGTGGFGVASSFSDSVKSLLSTTNIQSHCSLHVMGIIPSIKSSEIKFGVKGFADSDPGKDMEKLAILQGATAGAQKTVASSAAGARKGGQLIALENAKITSTLSALRDVDEQSNKIIDINTMMTALDDYVQRCLAGGNNIGVPLNYYLKPITKKEIAKLWIEKYYPYGKDGDQQPTGGDSGGGE